MNKISKVIKGYPFLLITILVSIISIFFFFYLQSQINLFPDNTVKKLYYIDNISKAHLKIIEKFNQKYKNEIEIIPVNLPFYHFTTNDRKEILTRSLRSRSDGIDIFAVDLIWIPRFAKWGYSMENYFDEKVLSGVNEKALKVCYHEGNLVAFPLFLDVGVLYYRKDLIRSLPDGSTIEKKIQNSLTWSEFINLGKNFHSMKNPYYIFTGGNFEGMLCCYHEMLSNDESNNIFNKNSIDLNTKASKRALQQLVDFIYNYKFSP